MKKPFSILHELEDTQFLIDTDYDHQTEMFELSFKFWSDKINGFIKTTMEWEEGREDGYLRTFEKFKDVQYCLKYKSGIEA